jgi:CDP-diacylglycerol pyrophosphatase
MPHNDSREHVNRRRFMATSTALSAAVALAGLSAWPAFGDPASDATNYCGNPKGDDDVSLWKDVRDATPAAPHPNTKVDFPINPKNPDRKDGYAVHVGGTEFAASDWLFLPLIRVTGIECPTCWTPGDMLNLWPWAAKWAGDPASKLAGEDWILAINSGNKHKVPQMHIHVTKFDHNSRTALDAALAKGAKPATTASDWPNHTVAIDNKLYRWLQLKSIDHQLFTDVFDYVAKKDKKAMIGQVIAVVQVDHTKPDNGYYVLNSDRSLSAHPPVGVDYVDNLMYRKK